MDDIEELIVKIKDLVCNHPELITKEGIKLEQKNTLPYNYFSTFGVQFRLHCESPVIFDMSIFAAHEAGAYYHSHVLERRTAKDMRKFVRGRLDGKYSSSDYRIMDMLARNGLPSYMFPTKPLYEVINRELVRMSCWFYDILHD